MRNYGSVELKRRSAGKERQSSSWDTFRVGKSLIELEGGRQNDVDLTVTVCCRRGEETLQLEGRFKLLGVVGQNRTDGDARELVSVGRLLQTGGGDIAIGLLRVGAGHAALEFSVALRGGEVDIEDVAALHAAGGIAGDGIEEDAGADFGSVGAGQGDVRTRQVGEGSGRDGNEGVLPGGWKSTEGVLADRELRAQTKGEGQSIAQLFVVSGLGSEQA